MLSNLANMLLLHGNFETRSSLHRIMKIRRQEKSKGHHLYVYFFDE